MTAGSPAPAPHGGGVDGVDGGSGVDGIAGRTSGLGAGADPDAEAAAEADGLFAAESEILGPGAPAEPDLDPHDPLTHLQTRLRTLLLGLPAYFEFSNHVAGVNATDLHSLNTLLGTSIEGQVVKALNQQRPLWDPDNEWLGYTFERQSQRFPDVRLVRKGSANGPAIALGIELKGWFLLAKEGEPSFRFTTTAGACAVHDLLVVVPWYLDNVLSGSPVAAQPYVASARWAADYRTYYWQHARDAARGTDRGIHHPADARPYPARDAQIADVPAYDGGKNFGRVARVRGMMDDFIRASHELEVLGIRIQDWYRFLRIHSDQADPDQVSELVERDLRRALRGRSAAAASEAARAVRTLGDVLGSR
ncbi:hypothetical protein [Actinopolymorpha rutila]|uniref:Uncharacterized protein n=1 Tax=Actinopolymorpha rutila TaxID=446787 RepID=A0A852ZKC3_9ACTN|nr:hypothetical protein [Actinopolymorpha rutila]NYH88816.1 hypothetical protein [Actinopolymorpha rutila]